MELKYFKPSDFDCSCGCGTLPKEEIMLKADEIREGVGIPLAVSSGARCRAKQDKLILQRLTRATNSKHIAERLADGTIKGGDAVDLAPYLQRRSDESVPEFNLRIIQTMKKLQGYLLANAERLGIWLEHFDYCPTWCHVQRVPYPSWVEGKSRVFKP